MKPISNLIAVYEARNVIYVKRGGLGFLINMKQDESGPIAMTDNEKKEILQQHFGKFGVGKDQLPYGLSDIPLSLYVPISLLQNCNRLRKHLLMQLVFQVLMVFLLC